MGASDLPEPGAILDGRFQLAEKIGIGGMGDVWVARNLRTSGDVAIKTLHPSERATIRGERLRQEARLASTVAQRNIVRVYDLLDDGAGSLALVMELLRGHTLASSMRIHGRFTAAQAVAVACAVLAGLQHAHDLGIVHRDVKPANIFLTYDGEVKLIDFGLAKSRGREAESQDGIVKGKLPYLSPEQARGEPIDRRVDIFALGTTLWEIGTMRRLFKRADDVETLRAIQDPKIEDPRTLVRRYPETLARIVDRALKVSPDERYATAHDLGRDLDIFVRDASDQDMAVTLRAMLAEVYPGEREKHLAWIDRALPAPRATPPSTMPPPTPVPTASSRRVIAAWRIDG